MAGRIVDTTPTQVHDFFVSKGWSSSQAYGIAGNIQQESGFASNAVNKTAKETSFGLFQFNSKGNPAAYTQFEKLYGKPLEQASNVEQMEFVNWQLHNTESSAGNALSKTSSPYEAGMVFGKTFERPAVVESVRGTNAENLSKGFIERYTTAFKNTLPAFVQKAIGYTSATGAVSNFAGDYLETGIGIRIGTGIVGLALLSIGLYKIKL